MFYSLPNSLRKESRYFLQYLNKFPFTVIVSNFGEITPLPTNLKVPNLQSDFSVSNSVRSNFYSCFRKPCPGMFFTFFFASGCSVATAAQKGCRSHFGQLWCWPGVKMADSRDILQRLDNYDGYSRYETMYLNFYIANSDQNTFAILHSDSQFKHLCLVWSEWTLETRRGAWRPRYSWGV